MNKKTFLKKMSEATGILYDSLYHHHIYSCWALERCFGYSSNVKKYYEKIMNPKSSYKNSWYGLRCEDNYNKRLLSLLLFKEVMLESGMYKEIQEEL